MQAKAASAALSAVAGGSVSINAIVTVPLEGLFLCRRPWHHPQSQYLALGWCWLQSRTAWFLSWLLHSGFSEAGTEFTCLVLLA